MSIYFSIFKKTKQAISFKGKHIFITGGSQGLGRELARQLVALGSKVTIIARGEAKLNETIQYATQSIDSTSGSIQEICADVTQIPSLKIAINHAIETFGSIDILIPCVGMAKTGSFFEFTLEQHQQAMNLNYFSTLSTIQLVLPNMLQRSVPTTICFITSALAMTSYTGYVAYSPTKYALRGLADTLRNELQGTNVNIHISYPANMDTPGFEIEQRTKPDSTKKIESQDTIFDPSYVAQDLIQSLKQGQYQSYGGAMDVKLLGILCSGLSPRQNPALDILLFPIAIIVAFIVRRGWDQTVQKYKTRVDYTSYSI